MIPSERHRQEDPELVLNLKTEGYLTPTSRVGGGGGRCPQGWTDRQVGEKGWVHSQGVETTKNLSQGQTLIRLFPESLLN